MAVGRQRDAHRDRHLQRFPDASRHAPADQFAAIAHRARRRIDRRFPDGQLYVDLLGATAAPLLPGDVLARFLRDLGVDGRDVPVDEDERAARYRTTLAHRRMLVVLDNARDAAQVRPLLPGSASSAVLVTTRSRMPDLASTKLVDLNVLDDDEALKLFVKVVGEERAAAEPEATAELLDACAGLPLAIRICAARLVTRSGWTIRAMAGRLTDEHRRLDEMRAGDLAVRASFEVSFTSLPLSTDKQGIDPALAFRLLGLWQGPSISAAAAAALGLGGHFANVLPDLDGDRAAGVRGLPQRVAARWGPRAVRAAAIALLLAASVLLLIASGPGRRWIAITGLAISCALAVVSARGTGKVPLLAAIGIAGVDVLVFAAGGDALT